MHHSAFTQSHWSGLFHKELVSLCIILQWFPNTTQIHIVVKANLAYKGLVHHLSLGIPFSLLCLFLSVIYRHQVWSHIKSSQGTCLTGKSPLTLYCFLSLLAKFTHYLETTVIFHHLSVNCPSPHHCSLWFSSELGGTPFSTAASICSTA